MKKFICIVVFALHARICATEKKARNNSDKDVQAILMLSSKDPMGSIMGTIMPLFKRTKNSNNVDTNKHRKTLSCAALSTTTTVVPPLPSKPTRMGSAPLPERAISTSIPIPGGNKSCINHDPSKKLKQDKDNPQSDPNEMLFTIPLTPANKKISTSSLKDDGSPS